MKPETSLIGIIFYLLINLIFRLGKLKRNRSPFRSSIFVVSSNSTLNFCNNFTTAIFISVIAKRSPGK